MTNLLILTCVTSLAFNLWLFWKWKSIHRKPDIDASEMLRHLFNGGAVLQVKPIDPADLLLYKGGR